MPAGHSSSPDPPRTPGRPQSDARDWLGAHGDALFRFALLRTADRELAEDLVQETLLAAWRGRDSFQGQSTERTWLIGILKHKLIDHVRREARTPIDPETQDLASILTEEFAKSGKWRVGPRAWRQSPADAAQTAEFWDVFERCLAALPPRLVVLFTERELGDRPSEDLCKLLGVSSTNLWTLLHRARARLRKCLELHWFSPPKKE